MRGIATSSKVVRHLARRALEGAGYYVTRQRLGLDPMRDIRTLLADVACPTVFDVGANVGETVVQLKRLFPCCELHAFEPGPETFRALEENIFGVENVHLVNAAVGATAGTQPLIENEHSVMSSFLAPGELGWGKVVRHTPVEVTTLDAYCAAHGVERIHLLKSDTQGYELEVLKGAEELMAASRIGLVYIEIVYAAIYEDLPSLDEVYRFLADHHFSLVAFYNFTPRYEGELPSWCDALFASEHARGRSTRTEIGAHLKRLRGS